MPRKEGETYGIDLPLERSTEEVIKLFGDASEIDRRFAQLPTDSESKRDHENLSEAAKTAQNEIRAALAKYLSRITSLGFGH